MWPYGIQNTDRCKLLDHDYGELTVVHRVHKMAAVGDSGVEPPLRVQPQLSSRCRAGIGVSTSHRAPGAECSSSNGGAANSTAQTRAGYESDGLHSAHGDRSEFAEAQQHRNEGANGDEHRQHGGRLVARVGVGRARPARSTGGL